MTRTSRSVSFTQDHYNLLDRVARERRKGFSETLRRIIDFVLDHDSSLGLPFYADREKSLQVELLTIQEARKKLEEEQKSKITDAPQRVFEEVTNSASSKARTGSKASFIDKRSAETEHERWQKKLPYLVNPKGLQKEQQEKVMETVLEEAGDHPDWVDEETGETKVTLLKLLGAQKRRRF